MNTFTAIDFETAQGHRWSICQVGLVRVTEGIITKELNILVQPPDNYYWYNFTKIHGITASDTAAAPTFDKIWPIIAPYIKDQLVIAHNGFGFDFPVLAKTLDYYGVSNPEYKKQCTYKIYKSNLANLCKEHKIELNHHDALSDARACATLYIKHLNQL